MNFYVEIWRENMKDYLKENLSNEEKAYIYGIIHKTALKYIRNLYKIKNNEEFLEDSINFNESLFSVRDNDEILDKILETKILKDINSLKPYSAYEKEKIIEMLDNIASKSELNKYIKPLTSGEKLVVFLLYLENYQVNEVSILLDISRMAIWKRDKSIKSKINIVKENIKND